MRAYHDASSAASTAPTYISTATTATTASSTSSMNGSHVAAHSSGSHLYNGHMLNGGSSSSSGGHRGRDRHNGVNVAHTSVPAVHYQPHHSQHQQQQQQQLHGVQGPMTARAHAAAVAQQQQQQQQQQQHHHQQQHHRSSSVGSHHGASSSSNIGNTTASGVHHTQQQQQQQHHSSSSTNGAAAHSSLNGSVEVGVSPAVNGSQRSWASGGGWVSGTEDPGSNDANAATGYAYPDYRLVVVTVIRVTVSLCNRCIPLLCATVVVYLQ
jgi:hypothetical protein